MTRVLAAALLLLAMLVVWGAVRDFRRSRENREWQERAKSAEAFAVESKTVADSAVRVADIAVAIAARFRDSVIVRTRVVERRITEIREIPVPDSCVPLVAPRDSIIDELRAVATLRERALAEQEAAIGALRIAAGHYKVRGDSLAAVLADRPTGRAWWLPRIGIGPFAGICAGGLGCAGIGVSIGIDPIDLIARIL